MFCNCHQEEEKGVIDGSFKGVWYFDCLPRRAMFVKLSACRPDSRFRSTPANHGKRMRRRQDSDWLVGFSTTLFSLDLLALCEGVCHFNCMCLTFHLSFSFYAFPHIMFVMRWLNMENHRVLHQMILLIRSSACHCVYTISVVSLYHDLHYLDGQVSCLSLSRPAYVEQVHRNIWWGGFNSSGMKRFICSVSSVWPAEGSATLVAR